MNVSIEKIEILSFGKLKQTVVNPSKGINVLTAPNESGKTTLASFIKYVFYGFSGTRNQTLTENEKKLYTPWEGEISEGAVTLDVDGKIYTVYRKTPPSGKETVAIINRKTNKAEFSGEVPGEVFFGVTEPIFARTLFFRQLTLPQSKDEVLADRLRNIAISADEQVETKKAVTRLNNARNELKNKLNNGMIPKLQRELEEIDTFLSESAEMRRDISDLRGMVKNRKRIISEGEIRLGDLRDELENIEKYRAFLKLETFKKTEAEVSFAYGEYETAAAKLKSSADSKALSYLSEQYGVVLSHEKNRQNLESSLNREKVKRDELVSVDHIESETLRSVKKSVESLEKTSKVLLTLGLVLLIFGVGLAIWKLLLGASLTFVGAAVSLSGLLKSKKAKSILKDYNLSNTEGFEKLIFEEETRKTRLDATEKQISELEREYNEADDLYQRAKNDLALEIGKYVGNSQGDEKEKIQFILSASAEASEKKSLWESKKARLDALTEDEPVAVLMTKAQGAVKPKRERNEVEREIKFYENQISQLSELNRRNELEIATFEARSGDPATLTGKRNALEKQIEELSLKHKAYETAIKVIEESGDYMKSMVAPRIGKRADEYFGIATGNKYSSLEIDTHLSMSFGEDFRKSCDYLSAGTRDSAYLSLRLALADMLFGGGVPVILDDAFGRMDDERLGMMFRALEEAAKRHQIIILSHGSREKETFDDLGVGYNEIGFIN